MTLLPVMALHYPLSEWPSPSATVSAPLNMSHHPSVSGYLDNAGRQGLPEASTKRTSTAGSSVRCLRAYSYHAPPCLRPREAYHESQEGVCDGDVETVGEDRLPLRLSLTTLQVV